MPTAKRRQAGPSDLEMIEEIRRADELLRDEKGGPLGWVCAFVSEDPKSKPWTPIQTAERGYRLLALAEYGGSFGGGRGWILSGVRPLTIREVLALHREMGALLRRLVSAKAGEEIELPSKGLRTFVMSTTTPGPRVKRAPFGVGYRAPLRTMVFQRLGRLVLATDRLVACPGPGCGRPFLALHKRRFHSDECAQRWHNREKSDHRREAEKGMRRAR